MISACLAVKPEQSDGGIAMDSRESETLHKYQYLYHLSGPRDTTGDIVYEKTDDPVEKLTIDGTTYYLFSNANNIVGAWRSGNVECSITGNISFEELRTLIKSIPGTQG